MFQFWPQLNKDQVNRFTVEHVLPVLLMSLGIIASVSIVLISLPETMLDRFKHARADLLSSAKKIPSLQLSIEVNHQPLKLNLVPTLPRLPALQLPTFPAWPAPAKKSLAKDKYLVQIARLDELSNPVYGKLYGLMTDRSRHNKSQASAFFAQLSDMAYTIAFAQTELERLAEQYPNNRDAFLKEASKPYNDPVFKGQYSVLDLLSLHQFSTAFKQSNDVTLLYHYPIDNNSLLSRYLDVLREGQQAGLLNNPEIKQLIDLISIQLIYRSDRLVSKLLSVNYQPANVLLKHTALKTSINGNNICLLSGNTTLGPSCQP